MGFFDILFKKKSAVEVQDPVFGAISLTNGIWGYVPKTSDVGFLVTVDAPETGPTDRQRDLFQRIRSSLSDFEHRARDFIRPRVDESVDATRLSVYSVEIGNDDETARQQFVLELSDEDADVIHRVIFRAGEPVDYGFDN
jgi:hypothetical protein